MKIPKQDLIGALQLFGSVLFLIAAALHFVPVRTGQEGHPEGMG